MPNQTWQSDFTHYRLATGADVEIITWLDDCTRYALHASAHRRVTTPIVKATFGETAAQHGIPASTLTDNGMVYTVRLAGHGRRGGRNGFEQQLRTWNVVQKNSRPNHPGRTARSNGSTAPWRSSGPTGSSTSATTTGPQPLHHGSSTTTLSAGTPHSRASRRPAACHQRDGRVQLAAMTALAALAVVAPVAVHTWTEKVAPAASSSRDRIAKRHSAERTVGPNEKDSDE